MGDELGVVAGLTTGTVGLVPVLPKAAGLGGASAPTLTGEFRSLFSTE